MATEKRLIDAKFAQHIANVELSRDEAGIVQWVLSHTPTVDAVEVLHGQWVSDEGDVLLHCSECETQISTSWDYDDLHWNYCPYCGAKMDRETNKVAKYEI